MHGEKRESETESKSCLFIEILLGDMFGPISNMGQCNISSIIMSIVMILTMLERCNRSDQQEQFLAPQGAFHANFLDFHSAQHQCHSKSVFTQFGALGVTICNQCQCIKTVTQDWYYSVE